MYNLKLGDIVIINDDNKKRLDWFSIRVIKIMPGSDGNVRLVRLKTQKGELTRPVQRLCPFELDVSKPDDCNEI